MSPTTRSLRLLSPLGLSCCLALSGCLGSPPPSTEYLTLSQPGPAAPETERPDLSVGLGPFSVAPHLRRRSLAYRIDERRVEFADSAQWAAPLDEMVGQHVTTRVGRAMGIEQTTLFPWAQSRAPDIQVMLHLEEFAVGPGPEANVTARWTLRDPATGRGLDGGEWTNTLPVDGRSASEQVSALSAALDALSDFLVQQVRAQADG